jgi:hypothetical protein
VEIANAIEPAKDSRIYRDAILFEFLHDTPPQNGRGTFFTAAFGAFTGAFAASRAHNKTLIALRMCPTVCRTAIRPLDK